MSNPKVAIITGASRGIGAALVKGLSDSGMIVVLASRNKKQMQSVSNSLLNEYSIVQTDVRDEMSVKNLVSYVYKKYKRIDVLVNNAGFVEPLSLLEMSKETWDNTIASNLTGTFLMTKEVVRIMKKDGGKVINIASSAGLSSRPGWSAYAASKAAVINFSLTMAEELRDFNIQVYPICPGRTATDLRKKLAPNEDPTTIMQPSAVVDVVLFCLTDNANTIEGQPILVREK
jgi:3-oxoacyl-[acyl-carrier protein] reductase|tara:strand:+ start:1763 stop:2455 length:693 start_codon:yes stop_codon:yes gene_type:complete